MVLVLVASAEQEMIEQIGSGGVDWRNGYVHVIGYGVPPQGVYGAQAKLMARGAAKADAYRNAVEVLKGVRVDSQSYVRNYVMQNDEVRIKGRRICAKRADYRGESTCRRDSYRHVGITTRGQAG